MRVRFIAIVAVLLNMAVAASAQYHSKVWDPDLGNGRYKNPVLNADYSDPDVCAVGGDYYLTASSFNCVPGLPVLHSRDLVNWEIIGHALQHTGVAVPAHGKLVWAPAIRFHDGKFYIYWGDPDKGVFMVSASEPSGIWSEPVCVVAGKGMIDPCPLWDDDGRCFLVNAWANSRAGFNSVLTMRELSPDGTRAVGNPVIVFDGGAENHTTEGPKLYKRDGWYWIMCPAGGVKQGWQLAMRSRSVYGPYEWKKVMAEGTSSVNGPHQGGWIHTPQGEDWFLHFNDRYAYGRVVYLQPVTWRDNWPVIGRVPAEGYCGEPVTTWKKPKTGSSVRVNPQESDEFSSTALGLQWQWQADYRQDFGMPMNNGWLRLYTFDEDSDFRSLWQSPNLLLQKLPATDFTATAKVRFASKEDRQYGGIVMMGRDYQALVVNRVGDGFNLEIHSCKGADTGASELREVMAALKATDRDTIQYSPAIYIDIYLRMTVSDGHCQMAYSLDGRRYKKAGSVFTLKEGKWIGAKMGLFAQCAKPKASRGWLDVDWFRVE